MPTVTTHTPQFRRDPFTDRARRINDVLADVQLLANSARERVRRLSARCAAHS